MFLQKSNAKKNEHSQETWVRRSAQTLTETYPYWSIKQIRLTLDTLEKNEYIFSKVENEYVTDRTKSYIISRKGLALLGVKISVPEVPKRQMEVPDREHEQVPKRQMEVPDREHEQVPKRADANSFSSFTEKGFTIISSPAADAPDAGPTVKVEEIEAVEDGKNGAASRGGGPQTKSWSQRAATIFDEVNEAMSKKERLEYSAFNWKVCKDQNFKQLENLKKIIEPGFAEKNNGAMPNDQELDDCFRAYFLKAWQYFYKLQKDTAGAFHYTPTTIYKSFNQIKSFKNGNINGNTINGTTGNKFGFGQGVNDTGAFDPKRGY